jgi:hypothetical protein
MYFGINSVIQLLFHEDEEQYCKYLFALEERDGNDDRDENVGVTVE